jgi:hypothetical protein
MTENIFLSHLNRSIKENVMISVFSNENEPDKCSTGFIETISDEQFVMKHVTPNGKYDGYAIRKLDDIFRIDFNGDYERRLSLLYNLQNQSHRDFFVGKVKKENNLFSEALLASQKTNIVVNVCIDETESQEDIVGFVKRVKGSEVVISRVSFEGSDDGESIFTIKDIVKMNIDAEDERMFTVLFNSK